MFSKSCKWGFECWVKGDCTTACYKQGVKKPRVRELLTRQSNGGIISSSHFQILTNYRDNWFKIGSQ